MIKTTMEDIMDMDTLALMEYLKHGILVLKYGALDHESFIELGELVNKALERLSEESELLAMPYKVALCER